MPSVGCWESADTAWRDQYREYVEYQTKENLAQFKSEFSEQVLMESLDLFDLLFGFLAVASAWAIGSGSTAGGGSE